MCRNLEEATMRTLRLHVAILAFVVIRVTVAAGTGCEQRGSQWLLTEKDARGYSIRFANPPDARKQLNWGGVSDRAYAAANQLPPGRASILPPAEFLSDHAGATAFFVGHLSTRVPIPLDGVWRGADPLSCLRSFAQAAGLEVVVPQPDLWVIGPPELAQSSGLLVFAYSMDITLQPLQSETTVGDLERALLSHLPVREIPHPAQRDDGTLELSSALIGLGYYAVPGEPDTYLIVATKGTFTNPSYGFELLSTVAFKVRVQRRAGQLTVDCLWSRGVTGPLVAGVQEDLNGDGVQDFYFQEAGDSDQPDLIVAGSDGSVIAKVSGETLAVEKRAAGPKRFSVKALWEQEGKARVYRFNPETKELAAVGPKTAAASTGGDNKMASVQPVDWPGEAMVAEVGSPEAVRVYCLPGFRAPHTPGTEFIKVHSSSVWGWFLNKNPKQAIEQIPPDLAMHVVFRYLSPGYLKEREKERAAQQP